MKAETPSRRVVLRRALAIGCGLVLPTSMLGCDSKPSATTPAAAPAAPPATAADSAAAVPEVKKVTQSSVQYQGKPKEGQKCADCMHFLAASNSCHRVEGPISPDGWCLLWMKKA